MLFEKKAEEETNQLIIGKCDWDDLLIVFSKAVVDCIRADESVKLLNVNAWSSLLWIKKQVHLLWAKESKSKQTETLKTYNELLQIILGYVCMLKLAYVFSIYQVKVVTK